MHLTRRLFTAVLLVLAFNFIGAAQAPDPIERIREADIKADLFALAGDAMRGREGGTLDEMTASVVGRRARARGRDCSRPATTARTSSSFRSNDFASRRAARSRSAARRCAMGRDVVPDAHGARERRRARRACNADALAGARRRQARRSSSATPAGARRPRAARSRPPALRTALRTLAARHPAHGHAAESGGDRRDRARRVRRISGSASRITFPRGTYGLDPDGTAEQRVAARAACRCSTCASPRSAAPLAADARLVASIFTDSFTYPSVNVIAKVPGRDP